MDNYSWDPVGLRPEAHFLATSAALADAKEQYNMTQLWMEKDEF